MATTDHIRALHKLVVRRYDFLQRILAAHVDFGKVFDAIHCTVLW